MEIHGINPRIDQASRGPAYFNVNFLADFAIKLLLSPEIRLIVLQAHTNVSRFRIA
jgi:hypothetical protein